MYGYSPCLQNLPLFNLHNNCNFKKQFAFHYTLYKVNRIVADTVHLALNKYETDLGDGLDDIAAKGNIAYDIAQQGLPKFAC